jgi:hypothetical protein
MRVELWPDETRHARFYSGVIIPPQPTAATVDLARDAAWRVSYRTGPRPTSRNGADAAPCERSPESLPTCQVWKLNVLFRHIHLDPGPLVARVKCSHTGWVFQKVDDREFSFR